MLQMRTELFQLRNLIFMPMWYQGSSLFYISIRKGSIALQGTGFFYLFFGGGGNPFRFPPGRGGGNPRLAFVGFFGGGGRPDDFLAPPGLRLSKETIVE